MIPALILIFVAVAWRVLIGLPNHHDFGWLHNFTPLTAIALCGALILPRRLALAVPLAALLASDVVLNYAFSEPLFSVEMLTRYVVLAGIAVGGLWLRKHPHAAVVLGGSALASVAFYFITNTASWIDNPAYAKTFAGWAQALISGVPGFPPTIVFFRNALMSDVLFTGLFLICTGALSRTMARSPEARWA
jgi:hypothetical protein